MKNLELARIFTELGQLLEYQGDSPFKINAYRRAAVVMEELGEDVAKLAAEDRLRDVPGVGEAIANKIKEFLETGKVRRHQEELAKAPSGFFDLIALPGIGPRTVALLHQHLGVETVADLQGAAAEGKIEGLPGIGKKKAENIAKALNGAP